MVEQGESLELVAQVLDKAGQRIAGAQIEWTSAASAIASVNSGVVTGVNPGTTEVIASHGQLKATATVTVTRASIARVAITPDEANVIEGRVLQLQARAFDRADREVVGREVAWSSNVPDVAQVDSAGVLTGRRVGGAVITATVEGRLARLNVQVVPVPLAEIVLEPDGAELVEGETLQLRAHLRGDDGSELFGRAVTWSSDAELIADVDAGGLVRATAPGQATLTAEAEGIRASMPIRVVSIPIAEVRINAPAYIVVGQHAALNAEALDASGNVLEGREIVWSSGAPAVAEFEGGGVLVGLAPGDTIVTATIEGKSATANLVVKVPVARIVLTPEQQELVLGQPLQLTARLLDENDNVLSDRAPSWSSSDAAVLSVDQTGFARALGAGFGTVRVEIEGRFVEATIEVTELRFLQLSASETTVCGLTAVGRVYCWGHQPSADPIAADRTAYPVRISGTRAFDRITVGSSHVCALDSTGQAFCMGENTYGALGDGSTDGSATFIAVAGEHRFSQIQAGGGYTCAVRTSDQRALCWGSNLRGELGVGDNLDRLEPTEVSGGRAFSRLAVSQSGVFLGSTCGITTAGAAYCWGDNAGGQIGDGTSADSNVPVAVGGSLQFREIAVAADTGSSHGVEQGWGHACGISTAGELYCWGSNRAGEVGVGTWNAVQLPSLVLGTNHYSRVSASAFVGGRSFTCAVVQGGQLECWGMSDAKLWGTWTTDHVLEPAAVGETLRFTEIVTGASHLCAIADTGLTYCWGQNSSLQCGVKGTQTVPILTVLAPNLVWGQQLTAD